MTREFYIPTVLRPNEWGIGSMREAWTVGLKDGEGMSHGPFNSEKKPLTV